MGYHYTRLLVSALRFELRPAGTQPAMLPLHHGTDLESQRGLEPLSLPWHGSVLPLHYCDLVEAPGLEPGPDSLQESRSRQLSYAPKKIFGAGGRTRTPNVRFTKPLL